jgi:hypothetical protein
MLGEFRPINVRVGADMGVKVAHGTIYFAQDLLLFDPIALAFQSRRKVGQFLTQGCWRGCLTMSPREHRKPGQFDSELTERQFDGLQRRHDDEITGIPNQQGIGKIIDVLRSAGKMQPACQAVQFFVFPEPFCQVVFHGFDIMVGGRFDRLDPLGILLAKSFNQGFEKILGFGADLREFRHLRMPGKSLEPAYFDDDPVPDQSVL